MFEEFEGDDLDNEDADAVELDGGIDGPGKQDASNESVNTSIAVNVFERVKIATGYSKKKKDAKTFLVLMRIEGCLRVYDSKHILPNLGIAKDKLGGRAARGVVGMGIRSVIGMIPYVGRFLKSAAGNKLAQKERNRGIAKLSALGQELTTQKLESAAKKSKPVVEIPVGDIRGQKGKVKGLKKGEYLVSFHAKFLGIFKVRKQTLFFPADQKAIVDELVGL